MALVRSDRAVLGVLLCLALLGVGLGHLVKPLTQQQSAAVLEEVLDLNRAPFAELLALPGIGPTLAERIIDYREEHGQFRTVEELLNVEGVGPRLLEKLAGKIRVSAAESPP